MLSTEREEFVRRLRVLFAGLDKPLGEAKETAFWIALASMSLIEFGRCCDFVLEELADGDKRREYGARFTPGDIWTAKRRLRAKVSATVREQTEPARAPFVGDDWDIQANMHLLTHVMRRALGGVHYASVQDRTRLHRGPDWRGDPETQALTAPLVVYKNAWARDMREWGSEPSPEQKRAAWADCMRRADAEVDQIRLGLHREAA
jgi:hypothetical protein